MKPIIRRGSLAARCGLRSCMLVIFAVYLTACNSMPTALSGLSGSSLGVVPDNTQEQQIFQQALGVGTVAGVAVGTLVGREVGGEGNRTKGGLAGGLIGGIVGAAIAREVAKEQIRNLRDVKLENENLEQVLQGARAYNAEIAQYNSDLKKEIVRLKKMEQHERARLAQGLRRKAELSEGKISDSIESRSEMAAALEGAQQRQLRAELRELKAEYREVSRQVEELRKIEEQAYIGALRPGEENGMQDVIS